MCLITFAFQEHPTYELILVANRDEFFHRPTLPMHFWENNSNILAGKDLQGKGTWLGLQKNGKFTALTNYRNGFEEQKNAPSRGKLTANFLENTENAQNYAHKIQQEKEKYNGFNLLVWDDSGFYYVSNYNTDTQRLEKGFYGLSNNILNNFSWQKVAKSKAGLQQIVQKPSFSTDDFIQLMFDTELASDEKLPDTGIPYKWEKGLSSMFISAFPEYGTRCTSVILKDYQGNFQVREISYNADKQITSDVNFNFATV